MIKFRGKISFTIPLVISIVIWSHSCSSNSNIKHSIVFDDHNDSLLYEAPDSIIYLDSLIVGLGDRTLLSLKERNGVFYLLDAQSKRLFAISDDGKTEYVIDRIGRGPGEYLSIIDFEVTEEGVVYMLTGEGDEVMAFDNGSFICKYHLSFRASSLSLLQDGDIAFFKQRYSDEKLGDNVLVITDPSFKVKNCFLEESSTLLSGMGEHLVHGVDNTVLCYQQYVNKLYWFDAKGIVSEMNVDFGEKVFPESLFAAEDFEGMFSIIAESSAYYINSCFENEHYLLLNITLFNRMSENNKYTLLYEKGSWNTFLSSVNSENPKYEAEGLPLMITDDNRGVFLYEAHGTDPASKYAIALLKIQS